MQFFDHTALSKLLTTNGIEEVVSEYSIKNVVPNMEMESRKPHFLNEFLRIRSPHEYEKNKFSDISSSKKMISQKLRRELDRLRKASKNGDLIFLCNYNFGAYELDGYSWPTFLDSMKKFLDLTRKNLSPAKCSIVLCGRKRPDNLEIFTGEMFKVEKLCKDVFYCSTAYDFEDAYFQKTSSEIDINYVLNDYWYSVLPSILESIKGVK